MTTNLLFDFTCGCSLLVFRQRGRGLDLSFRGCAAHADYTADDMTNLRAVLPLTLAKVTAASQPTENGGGEHGELVSGNVPLPTKRERVSAA